MKKNSIFRSIQTRILLLVCISMVLTIAVLLTIGILSFSNALNINVKNAMAAEVKGYGQILDNAYNMNHSTLPGYNSLMNLVGSVTVDGVEGSYCYVVDRDGIMQMDPLNEGNVGSQVDNSLINDLVKRIQSGERPKTEVVEHESDGSTYLSSYYVLNSTAGILVLTAEKEQAMLPVQQFTTRCIGATFIILILVAAISILMANSITKPIKLLTKLIDRNADFDFTESDDNQRLSKGSGETSVMSNSLNILRGNLSDMVRQLDNMTDHLKENASGLKEIVEQLNSNSHDNSATSEQLAASMEETAATTQLIDERMEGISQNTKKIGQLSSDGEKQAGEMMIRAEDIRKNSEQANSKTQTIYSKVKQESAVAIEKAKEIEQINALTEAIAAIASQTELLSLNASIEAARAGEAGRGFAVVASEIGNLAAQSTETASDISTIVIGVKDAAESMEKCLKEMIEFIEETVIKDYAQFIRIGEIYRKDAQSFSGNMQTIHTSMMDLEENINDITDSIQGINTTISEVADGITDISSKASDIVGLASDTSNKAEDNVDFAQQLDEIVGQFKI